MEISLPSKERTVRAILIAAIIMYVLLILYLTVFGRKFGHVYNIRLHPFSLYKSAYYGWKPAIKDIFQNLAMMFPLGYMLRTVNGRFLKTMAMCVTLSLSIEILQYLLGCGHTDIDDVIHNTVGAIVGCLLSMLIHRNKYSYEQ